MSMVELVSPLDMHLHLRDGNLLRTTAPLSSKQFSGALIMPNLIPPITTLSQIVKYKKDIVNLTKNDNFTPFMSLFFRRYNYNFLENIKPHILAIKLYPKGATTNSSDGLSLKTLDDAKETLDAMSSLNIPLCVHGETDGFVLDREKEFVPIYAKLAKDFPNLKIIMEHISTKECVSLLDRFDNLYATITVHHLIITLDDVIGGLLQPHLFCKPIAKTKKDRDAILNLALNAHNKVMFGSDSAPHTMDKKESAVGCAGIFTAPVALQLLAHIFEKHNKLENLQKFISQNARNIYKIKIEKAKRVKLIKKQNKIPNKYLNIVPLFSSKKISWAIDKIDKQIS